MATGKRGKHEIYCLFMNAYSQSLQSLLAKRRKLPVYGSAAKLLEVYHQNQVIILSSNTGSGKSTQVPQMLVYDEYSSGLMIACTQPRKLAAKELAKRVATEMGVAVGETVGFQVGGQAAITKTGDNTTRLSFMTEQTLVNQIMKDRKLSKYACVIVDEAHERTKEVDTLMPLLKEAVARRKDFKVRQRQITHRLCVSLDTQKVLTLSRLSSCLPLSIQRDSNSTSTTVPSFTFLV